MAFAILLFVGLVVVTGYRITRKVGPTAMKLFRAGDDLGGWTTTFDAGVPQRAGRLFTRAAKVVLWLVLFGVAVATRLLIPLVLIGVAWLILRARWRRAAAADRTRRSGMTDDERELMQQVAVVTFTAMALTAKGDGSPPTISKWRKQPVKIGGRPVNGQWQYSFLVRPAAGRSIPEFAAVVGRGLDADDDRLRDAFNSTLAAARSRRVDQLRSSGLFPKPFVLTSLEHVTRKGEKIGMARITLWSTDPFRRPVPYPHRLDRPVVKRFESPVPIGLLRNNAEAFGRLDVHSGIMGSNGSGKSSYVRPMLAAAAWLDCVIICIALKGPRDYADLSARFAGGTVITDPRIAAQVAVWARGEVERRNHLPIAELAKLPDIVVVIDEAQEMLELVDLWIRPAKLGRSARVWLKVVTQYAPSSVKTSEGGMSTMLLRELRDRHAGYIEGTYSHAQVVVSQRVTKSSGPHLIPPTKRWAGVMFNNDGLYERDYWLEPDSHPGRPSDLAVLASHLPDRPADPEGFAAALVLNDEVIELDVIPEPEWPEDGAERAADGTLVRLEVEDLDELVAEALRFLWPLSGKRNPPSGTLTGGQVATQVKAARARVNSRVGAENEAATDPDLLDAADLLERFLRSPLTVTV